MTEKEKMLAHVLYDATCPELFKDRVKCKKACVRYNSQLPYDDFDAKNSLLSSLFGSVGKNIYIEPPFWCDYGTNIHIGDNFYANHGLVVLDAGGVYFGDNVFIGPCCGIHTSGHPLDTMRRNAGVEYAWPIYVGNNVWLGAAVQLLPGVSIGNNCVIGAGSVVTGNIPDNCLAYGNPCRIIRKLDQNDLQRDWTFISELPIE